MTGPNGTEVTRYEMCIREMCIRWKLNSCGTSKPLEKFVTGLLKTGFGSL